MNLPPRPPLDRPLAISSGEPAGVGPEVTAAAIARLIGFGAAAGAPAGAAARWLPTDFLVFGDRATLAAAAALVGAPGLFDLVPVEHIPLGAPVVAGKPDAANAAHVLGLLAGTFDAARDGRCGALVTAPVQKASIADAGIDFSGHTEWFAERAGVDRVVMMLAGRTPMLRKPLRVALATTHLAVADVPAAITADSLGRTLDILAADLRGDFGIAAPRIVVAGLNPHAGEGGHLGREEIDVIGPALDAARARGIDVRGPLPADTLFHPRVLDDCDAVLSMFHDQGLPVLKFATFGHGVNITLGLPVVRTSVDHGTALDLAGTGRAEADSMIAAIEAAAELARHHARRAG
ncbi:4-hydroxythreonine-4-phosphate dehydrogenase PdxA [Derxia gummosa]|uniref:4-hydroxythreonine-4-phosphate dehydrogenase n=1 Tax=Derxia gummosa DSM 723 TaxID=1121388 RepID=A0A8B6X9Z7_9BURK|nr:4-hydroxythreonine-4-phosphate dehydrogenase PdxA [Derxia gummosa]